MNPQDVYLWELFSDISIHMGDNAVYFIKGKKCFFELAKENRMLFYYELSVHKQLFEYNQLKHFTDDIDKYMVSYFTDYYKLILKQPMIYRHDFSLDRSSVPQIGENEIMEKLNNIKSKN